MQKCINDAEEKRRGEKNKANRPMMHPQHLAAAVVVLVAVVVDVEAEALALAVFVISWNSIFVFIEKVFPTDLRTLS